MLIPKGLSRADWPGGMEGPAEDNYEAKGTFAAHFSILPGKEQPSLCDMFYRGDGGEGMGTELGGVWKS